MVMSGQIRVPATLPQATKGNVHKTANMTLSQYIGNEHNITNCNKNTQIKH